MDRIKTIYDALYRKYATRCPYELAEHLGIVITEFPFRKIRGLIFYLAAEKFIGVNAGLLECEKQAIIAHEIGHDQLHPHNAGCYFIKESTNVVPGKYELQADQFAALLLVHKVPEYGDTMEKYAARNMLPLKLVKIIWA